MKVQNTRYIALAVWGSVIILAGFAAGFLLMAGSAFFQNLSQRSPASPEALYTPTASDIPETSSGAEGEQTLPGIFNTPKLTQTGTPDLTGSVHGVPPPECDQGNYSKMQGDQEALVIKQVTIYENLNFLEKMGSKPKTAGEMGPGEVIWVVKDDNSPQVYPGLYFWKVRESEGGKRLGFVLEYYCNHSDAHPAFSGLENGYFLIPYQPE